MVLMECLYHWTAPTPTRKLSQKHGRELLKVKNVMHLLFFRFCIISIPLCDTFHMDILVPWIIKTYWKWLIGCICNVLDFFAEIKNCQWCTKNILHCEKEHGKMSNGLLEWWKIKFQFPDCPIFYITLMTVLKFFEQTDDLNETKISSACVKWTQDAEAGVHDMPSVVDLVTAEIKFSKVR